MDIIEYFDVGNKAHLSAFNALSVTGKWPHGFIPKDITFRDGWYSIITSRLAVQYLKLMLE